MTAALLTWILLPATALAQPGAANLNPAGGLRQTPPTVNFNPYYRVWPQSAVNMPVFNPGLGVGYQTFPVFWWLDPFFVWNPYNLNPYPFLLPPQIITGQGLFGPLLPPPPLMGMPPAFWTPPPMLPPEMPPAAQQQPAEPAKPVPPRPEPPGKDPLEQRALMQKALREGNAAFAAGNYATALRRFEQGAHATPLDPLPLFYQAQVQIALGQFPKAVHVLQRALRWHPTWPQAAFQPRALYGERSAQFDLHLARLAEAVEKHPNDADLLFLLGYQLWFDNRKDEARVLLRRAGSLTTDTAVIDIFLK